jgi:hypothetical protein
MSSRLHFHLLRLLPCIAALLVASCVEESPTVATFDQVLESTTFDNRLFAPVILFRDGLVLDTLAARTQRSYAIGRRGAIRHAWQILAPYDSRGQKAGIEPHVELGVQYKLNADYVIDYESVPDGTIFTPRVLNASPYDLRLIVNQGVDDQFYTWYIIRANSNSSLDHAPYFYWHDRSNVVLDGGLYAYSFSRVDTNELRRLRISDSVYARGSGLTEPLLAR